MKYFFSFFFLTLTLLFFSCKGTPDSQTEEIDSTPSESVEPSDGTEDIKNEIITDEIAELESEGGQADGFIEEQIDDTEELAEVMPDGQETVVLNEQAEEEPSPAEETPPVQTAPQVTQAPAQTPPPVSAPPPPVSIQPQTQTQAPPPVERQPPLPPPALLGSAEERLPLQRETVVPPGEPRRDTPAPVTGSEPPILPAVTPQNDNIAFSRIVRATVGQIIEIPFVGTGWIYMGELASRRGIVYNSTRRDPEGQSIIFGAEEAGTYVLRFYKDNFLSGYSINDYVQVIVGQAPSTGGAGWFAPPYDRGRVVALPRWPSALDTQQRGNEQSGYFPPETGESRPALSAFSSGAFSGEPSSSQGTASSQGSLPSQGGTTPSQGTASSQGTPSSQGTTSSQGTASSQGITSSQGAVPSQGTAPSQGTTSLQGAASSQGTAPAVIMEPGVILQRAGETFAQGNVAAAIALLDQYAEYFPNGTDELYWYYGQFYEANSPSRNILRSLDYYRRLVNEYPQSSRVNDARRRIAYLERFYINIQ